MKIFRFEAEGDTVYIGAETEEKASEKMVKVFGFIPEELVTVTEVKKLPKGETLL